jgi:hypothetical protein
MRLKEIIKFPHRNTKVGSEEVIRTTTESARYSEKKIGSIECESAVEQ